MTEITFALFAMHAVFAASFAVGFIAPLAIAAADERAERRERLRDTGGPLVALGPLLDIWLLLEDSIPVFWIFRLVREAPGDARAARGKWREESSIRLCFWISLILFSSLPVYWL